MGPVLISRTLLFYLSFLCVSLPAMAVVDIREFNSEADRERYYEFIDELRCPRCQNQNLAGSDAPIAQDLRRELHRLLDEGKSDNEIVDFMVNRYGDYVLYRPPLQRNTLLLWGLPLALLGVGVFVFAMILYRRHLRTGTAVDDASAPLSEQEAQQLLQVLDSGHSDARGAMPQQTENRHKDQH